MTEIAASTLTITCLVMLAGVWIGCIGFAIGDVRRRYRDFKRREQLWKNLLKK